jgi:carbon storage regulator CsrA
MLVLARKAQETIQIGDDITISIVRIKGRTVRVGIEAPEDLRVIRGELASRNDDGNKPDDPTSDSAANDGGGGYTRARRASRQRRQPVSPLSTQHINELVARRRRSEQSDARQELLAAS